LLPSLDLLPPLFRGEQKLGEDTPNPQTPQNPWEVPKNPRGSPQNPKTRGGSLKPKVGYPKTQGGGRGALILRPKSRVWCWGAAVGSTV